MSNPNTDPNTWAQNLSPVSVQLWREALAHLRHLSDEVWNEFKFFLAVDVVILLAMTALPACLHQSRTGFLLLLLLSVAGILLTLAARYILKRNRVYYLGMLMKKTLLEAEFGFYEVRFSGSEIDLAFPWRLAPETVAELKQKPEEWIEKQLRGPGTIARWLFLVYETLLAVYAAALILGLILLF